jgi:hypothetical protein
MVVGRRDYGGALIRVGQVKCPRGFYKAMGRGKITDAKTMAMVTIEEEALPNGV